MCSNLEEETFDDDHADDVLVVPPVAPGQRADDVPHLRAPGGRREDGLRLRGRADHQLKLGNGEKVCAAVLEAALHTHAAIHHAVVAAEPGLIAVIEPQTGRTSAEVWAAIVRVNAAQAVPYQRITALYVMNQHMSVENGMLTASLKVSRGQVLAAFRRWRCDGGPAFVRYECSLRE